MSDDDRIAEEVHARPKGCAAAPERRSALARWMQESDNHNGLTAEEIVDVIGYPYNEVGHYRYARCFDDLKALAGEGVVRRSGSRPTIWTAA